MPRVAPRRTPERLKLLRFVLKMRRGFGEAFDADRNEDSEYNADDTGQQRLEHEVSWFGSDRELRSFDLADHGCVPNFVDSSLLIRLRQRRVELLSQQHLARQAVFLEAELRRAGYPIALVELLERIFCCVKLRTCLRQTIFRETALRRCLRLACREVEAID